MGSLGVVCHQLVFGYRPFNDVSVEGIEEIVRNWRQYLHLSSEPSDGPTDFVRALLVDRSDRPSSAEALQHPWILASMDSRKSSSSDARDARYDKSGNPLDEPLEHSPDDVDI